MSQIFRALQRVLPAIFVPQTGNALVFSVFVVSLFASKGIRLVTHAIAIPPIALVFYLPTFLFFDFLAICVSRLLLWWPFRRGNRWWFLVIVPSTLGCLLSLIALGAASSQLSFFIETGGELEWREASSYATSKDGLKVLLTGLIPMLVSGAVIIGGSWLLSNLLYNAFGALLTNIGNNLLFASLLAYTLGSKFAIAKFYILRKRIRREIRARRNAKYSKSAAAGEFVLGPDPDDADNDSSHDGSEEDLNAYHDLPTESDQSDSDAEAEDHNGLLGGDSGEGKKQSGGKTKRKTRRFDNFRPRRIILPASVPWVFEAAVLAVVTLFFIIAFAVRPRKPYNHMSTTLPISLLGVFQTGPSYCSEQKRLMDNQWMLPHIIGKGNWEEPHGHDKGWAPLGDEKGKISALAEAYRSHSPSWLPGTGTDDESVPRGFFRWDPLRFANGFLGSHGSSRRLDRMRCPGLDLPDPFYNPVNDPLKISNLDNDVLEPIREALGDGSVKIKHVFFIMMESLRQDLFPLKRDSDITRDILNYNDDVDRNMVNDRLARMTPNAEQITGVPGGFRITNTSYVTNPYASTNKTYKVPIRLKWKDNMREGYGGVNIVGAYTSSTMSTKSFATNHCGAWSMPVDKFDEADTFAYQPCMPQILDLFNINKDMMNNATRNELDYREQKWFPALFESMTEQYDRQEGFDEKIGFKHKVTQRELRNDWRYNSSDPSYQEVNYFGFAEPVLIPYLREYIGNATADNQRMFMTHFTSTTHHTWDNPDWFGDNIDYLPESAGWHKDFNKYLNTVRFNDAWMGELMQILEDTGIANDTLVVFAGDHGQAFKEDFRKTGTYDVPHISNFHVPISFRHPNLPRVQVAVNASSVSILPTILDLLLTTGSLHEKDATVIEDILPEYEGQSLVRPYRASHNGRRAWNFSVINSGAGMLAVTSADTPYRLVMPMDKVFEYQLTDLAHDPQEHKPLLEWVLSDFIEAVRKEHGDEAATWASEAEAVGKWWALERQRLWRFHSHDGRDFLD